MAMIVFLWQTIMKTFSTAAVVAFVVAQAAHGQVTSQASPQQRAATTATYALLVGVAKYDKINDLHGPPNDVRLFLELLTSEQGPFQLPRERVLILTDWPEAGPEFRTTSPNAVARPTRANIVAAVEHLIAVAERGEGRRAIILLAGHGYQQPVRPDDVDGPDEFEEDGLDEVFLPSDAGHWNERNYGITNAITDNEIGQWLKRLTDAGVFVWLVMDSCYSGTGTRGRDETPRSPSGENPFSIPPEVIRRSQSATSRSRAPGAAQMRGETTAIDAVPPGVVAFFASRSMEKEVELPLLQGKTKDDTDVGLFSFNLARALTQAGASLSYAELMHQIYGEYARTRPNLIGPIPQAEGRPEDLRRTVAEGLPTRWTRPIRLMCHNNERRIDAGLLQNVTPDSILAVYSKGPTNTSERPVGFVRVRQAFPLYAVVEPVREEIRGVVTPDELPLPAICHPYSTALGETRVRVALTGDDEDELQALRSRLDTTEMSRFTRYVMTTVDAEIVITLKNSRTARFDAKPIGYEFCPPTARRYAVITGKDLDDIARVIASRVERAYTWNNLLNCARAMPRKGLPLVEFEMIRHLKCTTAKESLASGASLFVGEQMELQGRNTADQDLFVTIFYLEEDYGIYILPQSKDVYFPRVLRNNRFRAFTDQLETKFPVRVATWRPEHVLVLAIPVGDQQRAPENFSFLIQPPLPHEDTDARRTTDLFTRTGSRSAGTRTPLERLMFELANGARSGVNEGDLGGAEFVALSITIEHEPEAHASEAP